MSTPTAAPDMCSIAKAAEKAKIRAVDILQLILGRHLLRVGRVNGADGIAGLLVDPAEVRRVAPSLITGLAPIDAFRRFSIPAFTGWSLIEARGGMPVLPAQRMPAAVGGHDIIRVREADVLAFRSRNATLAHLTTSHRVEKGAIRPKLKVWAVEPRARRKKIGLTLYDRETLPESVAS